MSPSCGPVIISARARALAALSGDEFINPILAGGVAIEAFPIAGLGPTVRMWLAVFVTAVGMFIAGGAAFRWVRVERAMRNERPLPMPAIVPLLSAAAFVACAVVIVLFLR